MVFKHFLPCFSSDLSNCFILMEYILICPFLLFFFCFLVSLCLSTADAVRVPAGMDVGAVCALSEQNSTQGRFGSQSQTEVARCPMRQF